MSKVRQSLNRVVVLAACLLLASCTASSDSTGDDWCDSGGTGGPTNSPSSCGGPVHTVGSDTPRYNQCRGWTGEWACSCDSPRSDQPDPLDDSNINSEADTCDEALDDTCAVDPSVFEGCRANGLGRCDGVLDPSGSVSSDEWFCECETGGEGGIVEATSCDQALIDQCASDCQEGGHECEPTVTPGTYTCLCDGESERGDAFGPTCEQALDWACVATTDCEADGDACSRDGQSWECACTSYYEARRSVDADSCDDALEGACSPIGGYCNGWNGFCDDGPNEDGDYGYTCRCNDGTDAFVTPEQLGGVDDCQLALEDVCGLGVPDEDYQCVKESEDFDLICTKDEQEGREGFNCSCAYSCEDGAGAHGNFVETDSCREALGQVTCSGCS